MKLKKNSFRFKGKTYILIPPLRVKDNKEKAYSIKGLKMTVKAHIPKSDKAKKRIYISFHNMHSERSTKWTCCYNARSPYAVHLQFEEIK
jgi:hypothetical protein